MPNRHHPKLRTLSLIIFTDEARVLTAIHQPDRAIRLLKEAIELDPNFADAHRSLSLAYIQKLETSQSITEARRGMELDPNDSEQATQGYVYAVAGKTAQARAILADLAGSGKHLAVSPVDLSFIYVGLGQSDESLKCLERAHW